MHHKSELQPLYTQELFVSKTRVDKANLLHPITVMEDLVGNHGLCHGNHRSYRAFLEGKTILREVIGKLKKDISKDPYWRPISELTLVDK